MPIPEGWSADLARLNAAVTSLTARAVGELDGPEAAEVHGQIRSCSDQALAFAARLLARVEEDGRWAFGGARTFPEWAAERTRSSVGAARREATLGKALGSDLPTTARAVATGEITLEHAHVLARLAPTSEARRAALASDAPDLNEAALVEKARQMRADTLDREVKRWAARVDAAAHEREYQDAVRRERLVLRARDNGVAVEGFLTLEHGDVLATALRGIIGVPAADDPRTPDQRRAHALTELARLVLDRGLAGSGTQVRPHISVHVSWETFETLRNRHVAPRGALGAEANLPPAELDSGDPIPPSVLARIACDSEVTRIVFGPDSQPLDVGRAQRTYTGPQRWAVIARDRCCRYPGCDRPPVLCEVHHVAWWIRDHGHTAVEKATSLEYYPLAVTEAVARVTTCQTRVSGPTSTRTTRPSRGGSANSLRILRSSTKQSPTTRSIYSSISHLSDGVTTGSQRSKRRSCQPPSLCLSSRPVTSPQNPVGGNCNYLRGRLSNWAFVNL